MCIRDRFSDTMHSLYGHLLKKQLKFKSRLNTNFPYLNINTKLDKFYEYDFKSFISELKKQKIYLSLKEQDEWEEYFNEYKSEINKLQSEIEALEKEIDQKVYELYGLSDEEIKIVENNL